MPEKESQHSDTREPQGFTVHSGGLASEYARELGWGINEEERTKTPQQKQDYDGGKDYDYGAQDFGDARGVFDDAGDAQLLIQLLRFPFGGAMQVVEFFFVVSHWINAPSYSTPTNDSKFSACAASALRNFAALRLCVKSSALLHAKTQRRKESQRNASHFTFRFFLLTFGLCANV